MLFFLSGENQSSYCDEVKNVVFCQIVLLNSSYALALCQKM